MCNDKKKQVLQILILLANRGLEEKGVELMKGMLLNLEVWGTKRSRVEKGPINMTSIQHLNIELNLFVCFSFRAE